MSTEPVVFVVDDDPGMRQSLTRLIESIQLPVEAYASAQEFLEAYDGDRPGCLVLDIRMPGMSGLELQEHLHRKQFPLPVIVVTGHGDIPMAVRAMQHGAVDFIEKPFRPQILLDRVGDAVKRSLQAWREQRHRRVATSRLGRLTRREREVLRHLLDGRAVKEIATHLGLSHKTVQVHRAHIMEKTQCNSIADLIRVATAAGLAEVMLQAAII
jgi:two-component system response regulator FixJ